MGPNDPFLRFLCKSRGLDGEALARVESELAERGDGDVGEELVRRGLIAADELARCAAQFAQTETGNPADGGGAADGDAPDHTEETRVQPSDPNVTAETRVGVTEATEPSAIDAASSRLIGQVYGSYALEKRIGKGGQGAVYLARHTQREDWLAAVKVLLDVDMGNVGAQERLAREGDALRQLKHKNIVQLFDFGFHGDNAWLAMEYVEGVPADALAKARGGLGPALVRSIVADVLAALEEAHEAGLLHRDVKASNVLLRKETHSALLTDFGLAKRADQATRLTGEGFAVGTMAYMAPELFDGAEASVQSDLWAVGVLAKELSTSRWPFDVSTQMRLIKALESDTPDLTGIEDPHVLQLAEVCLNKDPRQRPKSARRARALLEGTEAPPPPVEEEKRSPLALAGSVVAVLAVALLAWQLWPGDDPADPPQPGNGSVTNGDVENGKGTGSKGPETTEGGNGEEGGGKGPGPVGPDPVQSLKARILVLLQEHKPPSPAVVEGLRTELLGIPDLDPLDAQQLGGSIAELKSAVDAHRLVETAENPADYPGARTAVLAVKLACSTELGNFLDAKKRSLTAGLEARLEGVKGPFLDAASLEKARQDTKAILDDANHLDEEPRFRAGLEALEAEFKVARSAVSILGFEGTGLVTVSFRALEIFQKSIAGLGRKDYSEPCRRHVEAVLLRLMKSGGRLDWVEWEASYQLTDVLMAPLHGILPRRAKDKHRQSWMRLVSNIALGSHFYMDEAEVSWGQWRSVLGAEAKTTSTVAGVGSTDDYPVYNVTAASVAAFCKKVGCRLPAEIEWNHVATRFGQLAADDYLFGPKAGKDYSEEQLPASAENIADQANNKRTRVKYADDGFATTAPVEQARFRATLGFFHWVGNVAELVQGPNGLVVRGADYRTGSLSGLEVGAQRDFDKPLPTVGFRCARDAR